MKKIIKYIQKRIRLLLIGILLVFAVAAGFQIVKVNQEYPQVQTEHVAFGQNGEMEDNLSMRVTDTVWRTREEAEALYGETFVEELETDYNYKAAEITVELTNSGTEEKVEELYNIYIENDAYCNGLAPEVLACIEDYQGMTVILEAGESRKVTLGYLLYESSFRHSQWEKLEDDGFALVYQRYPVKVKWDIQ